MTSAPVARGPRALAAILVALALALAAVPGAAAAEAPVSRSGAELRRQRTVLLQKVAALTDTLEIRQAELVVAQERRSRAEATVNAARRQLQEHAIEAFIHSHELAGVRRARNGVYADAIAEADDEVIATLDAALRAIRAEEQAAQSALDRARAAESRLTAARSDLEATLASVEALEAEARANAEARRLAELARPTPPIPPGATRRHREATAHQAELMQRFPFGPLPAATMAAGLLTTGQVVEGMASWYGPGFDGRPTASGAVYDQEGWTVASKELPLGTILLITHNDRAVLALVNDRGPYVAGRVLDLSHAVATALGTVGPGVAWVRAEVVVPG